MRREFVACARAAPQHATDSSTRRRRRSPKRIVAREHVSRPRATHGRSRPSALAQRRSARAACVSPGSRRARLSRLGRARSLSRRARALLSPRSRRCSSRRAGRTFCSASSSSLRFRARRTRTRNGTLRTPFDHRYLFSFVSRRTSFVFIIFSANFLISRTARGALVLNVRPCNRLFRFTVYSRDTRSATALFLSPLTILRGGLTALWRDGESQEPYVCLFTQKCTLTLSAPLGTHPHNSSPLARAPRREI